MTIFISWLTLSILAAVIAARKGRSAAEFLLLALLLSPLVGIAGALIASPNRKAVEHRAVAGGEMRTCPFCAELVLAEAKLCRYCRSELPLEVRSPPAAASAPPIDLATKVSDRQLVIGFVVVAALIAAWGRYMGAW